MKRNQLFKVLLLLILFMGVTHSVEAQFWKKLKEHAKEKIKREAEERSKKRIDKKIDKTFDKAENTIDGKGKKKKGRTQNPSVSNAAKGNASQQAVANSKQTHTPKVVWSKFDFVPGDEVIFEDAPSLMEENGEFPSRWDLVAGGAEIVEIDGENAITFVTESGNMYRKGIVPYLKNAKEDYLPDVFTIEYDAFYHGKEYNEKTYVTFFDRKNQSYNHMPQIDVEVNSVQYDESEGKLSTAAHSNWNNVDVWRHVSIAYTRGKLKVYLDDERLINIPHVKGNPIGVTLSACSKNMYIKNIRIAKGGVKYYDRVLQDGKIIANGIRFDVGKTTLKPESMGPINKIYRLMSKKPDLKFSVEGHTDSDGNDANNQTLSEGRAKVVMEKLVEMGISKDRLSSKGWGESKPIAGNDTPEGKANNRRVEFVVIK